MATLQLTPDSKAGTGLEPLYRPYTPGWYSEQIEIQGGTSYKPKTSTISDALTFLRKRSAQQLIIKSADKYKAEVSAEIEKSIEKGTPPKNIADALRKQVTEVNPARRALNFEEDVPKPKPTLPLDYSGSTNMIRTAIAYLNERNQNFSEGKVAEKVEVFNGGLKTAQATATEGGVPDQLIEAALVEKLEEVESGAYEKPKEEAE